MAVQNDFSKGSILSHMARIALPMTLAQFVNILYNIIDRVFIGRIPDHATEALTGLGVAFPICTLAIAFANLVGMGGAPLFSIERGKGNEEEAKYILGNSFNLLVVIGVVFSVVMFLVKRPMLYLLGASKNIYGYADSYLSIYLCGTLFVMLNLGMNAFINAQGFANIGMMTVSIGAVCNLILDPIFIFEMKMGVQGAALATVISLLYLHSNLCFFLVLFLHGFYLLYLTIIFSASHCFLFSRTRSNRSENLQCPTRSF